MNCEFCKKDPETIVILPISKPDGSFITLACLDCSRGSGFYCNKHETPHLGFEDKTSACTECIEETVKQDGEKIAGLFAGKIKTSKRGPEIEESINGWWEEVRENMRQVSLVDLSLAVRFAQTSRSENIARLILTRAQRMKTSPNEVIEEIINKFESFS